MNKIKIFAVAAFVPLFLACGEQDGSEAVITNNGALISPFDTLFVDFDSEIAVNELNIEPEGPATLVLTGNTSRLKFVGKNKTEKTNLPYFEENKKQEIVISNIRNADDYTKEKDTFSFRTIRILDDIEEQNNDIKDNAPDIDSIGTTIDPDGVSFAGILEHKISGSKYNLEDFYRLKLIAKDTVNITFNTLQANTKVELIGEIDSTSWIAKKGQNEFKYYIDCDDHCVGNIKDKIQFYLKISDALGDAPANPYDIKIGVIRK